MDETWVDPVIGARGRLRLSEALFLLAGGDLGGFDTSSSFTWQANAGLGYEVSKAIAVGAGYRALGYNYNHGGFKYNADMYGPFLGAEFKF